MKTITYQGSKLQTQFNTFKKGITAEANKEKGSTMHYLKNEFFVLEFNPDGLYVCVYELDDTTGEFCVSDSTNYDSLEAMRKAYKEEVAKGFRPTKDLPKLA
jgi:hypothetical protein